jgi:hypothetical protein
MTDDDRRQRAFSGLIGHGAIDLVRERHGQDGEAGNTGALQCD